MRIHGNDDFVKVSKNLDTDLKIYNIILLNSQNNYVTRSNLLLEYSNFLQHYSLYLRFLCNYFYGPIKLFSGLYSHLKF